MLFDVDSDPFELTDLAPTQPDLVASMSATLEQGLGGPGAISRIDAEQMTDNLGLYMKFYFQRCTGPSLLARFMAVFKGMSSQDVEQQVRPVLLLCVRAAILVMTSIF